MKTNIVTPEVNTNPCEASVRKKRIRTESVTILEEEDVEESEMPLFQKKRKRSGNPCEKPQTAAETSTPTIYLKLNR